MIGAEVVKIADKLLAGMDRSRRCAADLLELIPLRMERVRGHLQDLLWDALVREYHYLGHQKMVGCRLEYLVFSAERVIALVGWRAAALKLETRDCFIVWTVVQRKANIGRIANNNHMLILPWVRVRYLFSYLSSRNIKLLVAD